MHCTSGYCAAMSREWQAADDRRAELIWRHPWETRRKAEMAIFEYINGLYNSRRRRSALGWKSPVAFERKAA